MSPHQPIFSRPLMAGGSSFFGDAPTQLQKSNAMPPTSLHNRRVLVWGLGRFGGGVGVTRWLAGLGAQVTVMDQAPASALADSLAALAGLLVDFHLGQERVDHLDHAELVVVNPAVIKWKSDFFREIIRRKLPWTTEINLFCARCPASVVGVTGSYGNSTTSAMVHQVLDLACRSKSTKFRQVHLGGNIGRSLLTDLDAIAPNDIVVLELSNAQLEDLPQISWSPACAIITNIHPHHLDRYQHPEEYFEAKANIARDPAGRAPVIAGPLDPRAEKILRRVLGDHPHRLIPIATPLLPIELVVPGAHNRDNAACVLTVTRTLGIGEEVARQALKSFRGLPHRLEFVQSQRGVEYINDSKSTAPSATIKAIESFDRPVVLIVGGQKKDVPLHELASVAARRCRAVVCMGEAGADFSAVLGAKASVRGMADAVHAARVLAQSGDIVLLSPGAPSFDAYHNYEERGKDFARCVNEWSP